MPFSTFNSSLTLEHLRFTHENLYLERKGRDTKHTKLANEIIGMLNANGGVIIYGLHDNGTIEDLNALPLEKLDHYRKIIDELISPPAHVELEEITLDGGELIFLYHVSLDTERLFMRKDNEEVFLRVAESNKGPLKRDAVKKLEYNKHTRSYENELRPDFNSSDFNHAVCEQYREKMNYSGTFEDLAVKRNLASIIDGATIYKNAAILLFAEDPSQYIPNALVRYVRYEGVERKSGKAYNVIKDERMEEPIPCLIDRLDAFIGATLRDYYYLDLTSGKFEKVPEYPKEAWLEGIVNALCHRSYNLHGNSIYIKHYDNRLEISNSGPLPAQVSVENIQTERYSRNPRIARVLSEMGYVRELNEGVPRIFSSMDEFTLDAPEYTDINDTVTLTLKNKVTAHKATIISHVIEMIETHWENFNPTQRKMIQHLFKNQEATVTSMANEAEVGTHAIRYNLKKLIGQGIIERQSQKTRDLNAVYTFRHG